MNGQAVVDVGQANETDRQARSRATISGNDGCAVFEEELPKQAPAQVSAPLSWVWDGLIPQGKLTLVTGEPGVGKSLFAIEAAALVTRGRQGPDLVPSSEAVDDADPVNKQSANWKPNVSLSPEDCEPGAVLLFSSDDDYRDTLAPRLRAAGADLSQVFLLTREESALLSADARAIQGRRGNGFSRAQQHLERLQAKLRAIEELGETVRLIIIDPIDSLTNGIGGRADLSMFVAKLVQLAAKWNVAVLAVASSTVSGIGRMVYRTKSVGHQELASAARSVLMVAQDLDWANQRMVLPVKTNLCEAHPGLTFSFREGRIEWSAKSVALAGEQYLSQARQKRRNPLIQEEHTEIHRVTTWLRNRLCDGPVASLEVRYDATDAEIGYATLRRAFQRLGCRASKSPSNKKWYWCLPGMDLFSYAFWDRACGKTDEPVNSEAGDQTNEPKSAEEATTRCAGAGDQVISRAGDRREDAHGERLEQPCVVPENKEDAQHAQGAQRCAETGDQVTSGAGDQRVESELELSGDDEVLVAEKVVANSADQTQDAHEGAQHEQPRFVPENKEDAQHFKDAHPVLHDSMFGRKNDAGNSIEESPD